MQTGWQKINGSWYYLGPVGDGAMRKNQWVWTVISVPMER